MIKKNKQTIGILGGGQLGQMLSNAAIELGYNTHIYSPDKNSPAFKNSTYQTIGKFEDQKNTTPINGVLITATIRNGPAENAGIIPGDIILSINENITSSPERIIDMITKLKPGTKVKIKILRGWEERDLTAAILQRPAVRFLR